MPSALERLRPSVKVVVRMVRVAGERIAPPRPCAVRAAISIAWFWARPPARLAAVNRPMPRRKIWRRP
jgi:hypothetical protein